jgi:ActR/RegA family two-component response regulator
MPAPALSQSVLVVEDNWLLAAQTESWLEEDGIACAGTAANVAVALDLVSRQQPGFALVDLNLGSERSEELIAKLLAEGTKVIVMTGYSDAGVIDGISSVLYKPCTKEEMMAALLAAGLIH